MKSPSPSLPSTLSSGPLGRNNNMLALLLLFILASSSHVRALSLPGWAGKKGARSPPSLKVVPSAFAQVYPTSQVYPSLKASTVEQEEKQETLTSEDEAILFGEEQDMGDIIRKRDKFGNYLQKSPTSSIESTGEFDPLLERSADNPVINKLRTVRETLDACPYLWKELAVIIPDKRALLDEHLCESTVDLTFAQMNDVVMKSALVFSQKLGISKTNHVAVLGENSANWLLIDHGIQLAGGVSAVRGADAPLDELRYIYSHSDSKNVAVLQGPKLLTKLANDAKARNLEAPLGLSNEKYGPIQTVVLMHREKKTTEEIKAMGEELGINVYVFNDLLDEVSDNRIASADEVLPKLARDDVATIVYTSGTTGNPKGVALTHGNLIHQTSHRVGPSQPFENVEPCPGDVTVSLLPVWHITERTFELWMASRGCSVVYSNIRTFKNDLAKHKPQWLVLVPRVLEKVAAGVQDKFNASPATRNIAKFFTAVGNAYNKHRKVVNGLVVGDAPPDALQKLLSQAALTALAPLQAIGNKLVWSKVQDGFGGNIKTIISGGSALSGSLESFYETAGLTICVGYGLTECSPIISYRRSDNNLITAGCVGKPCLNTQLRVVNPDYKPIDRPRENLPIGQVGVVLAKGPQVMSGYYKNPEATSQAIDKWGWFDTGDLGRINPATGDLILTGRAKDTIVLSNGENIEPTPIEDSILGESELIDQVMLTGQDGRRLIAVCVMSPNELLNAGFLDKDVAVKCQSASEKVNDPKCDPEDCKESCDYLNDIGEKLRQNTALKQAILADVAGAHKAGGFRKWEQVGDIHITLEPFAMANGQLTQSYKVKRNAVLERYENELPK